MLAGLLRVVCPLSVLRNTFAQLSCGNRYSMSPMVMHLFVCELAGWLAGLAYELQVGSRQFANGDVER